ncbi:MAG: helix-turn-helix domain-containing protein, partial [Nitrospirota bacterium]
MPTIGEELKAAREAKGLSLTEIAEKTRISHTFLKALEEDDYSVIPGDVFITGFLRTYSKELGLSVKDMLARYRELKLPSR